MQSETGFLSSHQLKSYVASKSRLKLAARAVLSADAGLLVDTNTYRRYIRVSKMHPYIRVVYMARVRVPYVCIAL